MPAQIKSKTASQVKKSNAKFKKMTAAEKRVQIAKDVIAQLDTKRLRAFEGVYVRGRGGSSNLKIDPEVFLLDETLDTEVRDLLAPQCDVCAKGGLFVAAVDRFDKLKLGDDLCPIGNHGGCSDPVEYLTGFFEYNQLELIEYAFERGGAGDIVCGHEDMFKAAEKFGRKFRSDDARMRAIMKNVIKHNGTFKP